MMAPRPFFAFAVICVLAGTSSRALAQGRPVVLDGGLTIRIENDVPVAFTPSGNGSELVELPVTANGLTRRRLPS